MITENLSDFFADFGVSAIFGNDTANVLFDAPDTIIADGDVISGDYSITYPTGTFPLLSYSSTITVAGTTYTVRNVRKIEDGSLTKAYLKK